MEYQTHTNYKTACDVYIRGSCGSIELYTYNESMSLQLLKCGVPVSDIGSLGQLLETGRAAKTLALIVTSQQAT